MTKYKKKPVIIDAWLIGDLLKEFAEERALPEEVMKAYNKSEIDFFLDEKCIEVVTLEGRMRGEWEDYLIKGIKGEYYPCKSDIFASSYDPLDNEDFPL